MPLNIFITTLFLIAPAASESSSDTQKDQTISGELFLQKLTERLKKTETSLGIVRNQISESANAPFLADLYFQLANLLVDKANTLYFIHQEQNKGEGISLEQLKQSPIFETQREGIEVLNRILREFPKFRKRPQVLLQLVGSMKTLQQNTDFMREAQRLIADFPDTEEALKVRLLLGQFYLDQGDYLEAQKVLTPTAQSSHIFEAAIAKHRIALALIGLEKPREALTLLEEIIHTKDLDAEAGTWLSELERKEHRPDLKREALMDSIRVYPLVFETDPRPIEYYAKLAPTPVHYHEVIEKLSTRYLQLQRYNVALNLLRSFSEQLSNPEKVINIYRQVLQAIPPEDRQQIPPTEMSFVLQKYREWKLYFQVADKERNQASEFFEKHLRDLATTAHLKAKNPLVVGDAKLLHLGRAKEFYELYLAHFRSTTHSLSMAMDLADVHYLLHEYLESGKLYLQIFDGAFGSSKERRSLIENAILSFQRFPDDQDYYANIRSKALLRKTVLSYIQFDPKMNRDPSMRFLIAKADYQQGLDPSLEGVFRFAHEFRNSKMAPQAGELILNHYYTKGDFKSLKLWIDRLESLKVPEPTFQTKLQQMAGYAQSRILHQSVASRSDFNPVFQAKSFLSAAQDSGDQQFAHQALKEALRKSRLERDMDTFFAAAQMIADKSTGTEKFKILLSVALEYRNLTQFHRSREVLTSLLNSSDLSSANRLKALEELVRTALLLRDTDLLLQYAQHKDFDQMPPQLLERYQHSIQQSLESTFQATPGVLQWIESGTPPFARFTASLVKSLNKFTPPQQAKIQESVRSVCKQSPNDELCAWIELAKVDERRKSLVQRLRAESGLQSLQTLSEEFAGLVQVYESKDGGQDLHRSIVISSLLAQLYESFGNYLRATSKTSAEAEALLIQKARESIVTSQSYLERCQSIQNQVTVPNPASRACGLSEVDAPSLSKLFYWSTLHPTASRSQSDPQDSSILNLQKNFFFGEDKKNLGLTLVHSLFQGKHYAHALATGEMIFATEKEASTELRLVMGCSAAHLGYPVEALAYLKDVPASEKDREVCLAKIGMRANHGS